MRTCALTQRQTLRRGNLNCVFTEDGNKYCCIRAQPGRAQKGVCYFKLKKLQNAQIYFDKSVQLDPNYVDELNKKVSFLPDSGESEQQKANRNGGKGPAIKARRL